jgi:serine/threonine protein kinase
VAGLARPGTAGVASASPANKPSRRRRPRPWIGRAGASASEVRMPSPARMVMDRRSGPLRAIPTRGPPPDDRPATRTRRRGRVAGSQNRVRWRLGRRIEPGWCTATSSQPTCSSAETVKVTDFGVAQTLHQGGGDQGELMLGTVGYLSPEQASGQPATAASDLYALGVVAYECLAGRRPFTGEHPIAVTLAHLLQPPPPLPDEVPGWCGCWWPRRWPNRRPSGHRTPRSSATNC